MGFIIFLALGITLIVFSFSKYDTNDALKKAGVKTEGVIFDIDTSSSDIHYSIAYSIIKTKVLVRFVTKDKEWITASINKN